MEDASLHPSDVEMHNHYMFDCLRKTETIGHHWLRGLARPFFALMLLFAVYGCSTDKLESVSPGAPEEMYWSLELNHRAGVMSTVAPYDKLQLEVFPLAARGDTLPVEGVVTYTSSAPDKVRVTEGGLVEALATASGVNIIARLSMNNTMHADTLRLNVTALADPMELASFSIQPVAPDSAVWVVAGGNVYSRPLRALALDDNDTNIPSVIVRYTARDRSVLTVVPFTGALTGVSVGQSMIVASTTVYGVKMVDSVLFTIKMPSSAYVTINGPVRGPPGGFSPTVDSIGVGGSIIWTSFVVSPVDIVFDDPTNVMAGPFPCYDCSVDEGNIEPFSAIWESEEDNEYSEISVSRSFPVAGTYHYRSLITGKTGTIVVVDPGAVPAANRITQKR